VAATRQKHPPGAAALMETVSQCCGSGVGTTVAVQHAAMATAKQQQRQQASQC